MRTVCRSRWFVPVSAAVAGLDGWLGALAGLAYIAAIVVMRLRG